MIYQFLDTETTGIPDFKKPSGDECQPRVISVATITTDHNGNVLSERKALIKPDGWQLSEYNIEKQKLNIEVFHDTGLPIKEVYDAIMAEAETVDYFVAHQKGFDQKMMKIEALRCGHEEMFVNPWICTMHLAKDHCKIPGTDKMRNAGFTGFKPPTLQEAYNHFFGKDFEGAHEAGSDVWACKEIFFAINPPESA